MDHSYDLINTKEEILEETVEQTVEETVLEPSTEEEKVEQQILLEEGVDEIENGDKLNHPGSQNFYTKLIDLVRSYPNIYDKFDVNFKSTFAREKAWNEIAVALKITVPFAQNRWIRLRERFAREKKSLEVMHKTGNVNDRKRLWPYFLPMLFLSSHIKPRKTNTLVLDSTSSDSASGEMTISKFLSVMGDKLNEEFNTPSTSSVGKRDIEVIDDNHPDYLAWKKRKPETTFTQIQPPRKIMAKPDTSLTTLMFTTKGKDGEKVLTKLPPGAVLLKNPPGSMGGSPVVLVPTTPSGIGINKTGALPMIISPATQQITAINQSNSESSPTPNSAEHHFGMLIARELERFPKEVRAKKKQRILMVLYE